MGVKINKITISIVGAGPISEEHIRVLVKLKKNYFIKGIISKNGIRAKKLAKKYNIEYFGKNIKDLYNNTLSDLVLIVAPATKVKKLVFDSIKYPWKIFSEKPMGVDHLESKKIYDKLKKIGREKDLVVGLNRRNYDTTLYALSKINKKIKRLVQVVDTQNIFDKRLENFAHLEKKNIKKNMMYYNSIHLIDLMNLFCRGKLLTIDKKIMNLEKNQKIITSILKFSSGDIAIYTALWNIPGPWEISLTNTKETYLLKPLEKVFRKKTGEKIYKEIIFKGNQDTKKFKSGFYNQAIELLKFMKKKKNNLANLEQSYKSINLIKKIYS